MGSFPIFFGQELAEFHFKLCTAFLTEVVLAPSSKRNFDFEDFLFRRNFAFNIFQISFYPAIQKPTILHPMVLLFFFSENVGIFPRFIPSSFRLRLILISIFIRKNCFTTAWMAHVFDVSCCCFSPFPLKTCICRFHSLGSAGNKSRASIQRPAKSLIVAPSWTRAKKESRNPVSTLIGFPANLVEV